MAKLLPDELWTIIEPLLPPLPPPNPKGGRPPLSHRQALTGILFVLKTGLPWEDLPAELNCGSGMSCWRRRRDWQADGTWAKVHAALLERLHHAGKLDWSKCAIDGSSVRAVFGGATPGRTPLIGAKTARNTTCWWTAAASPWRPPSAPPTSPM
jgi:transposase